MALIELRVHGVSGTPPDVMLGTAPVLLEDRGETKIFRPAPTYGGLRAYQWGSLTSGTPRKALWLLLVPYLLLNVAGWALPPHPASPRRSALLLVRVAGLTLTVLFSFVAALGLVELGGFQLLSRRLGWVDAELGVALGGWATAVVLVALWMVTSGVEDRGAGPVGRFLRSRGATAGPDPASHLSVMDAATWETPTGETLRNLHIGAALTAVAAAVVLANGALSPLGVVLPGLLGSATLAVGIVVTAVVAGIRRDGTHGWVEAASFGLAMAAALGLALLLVLSSVVGPCDEACVADPSFGSLGDAVRLTALLYALLTAAVYLLGRGGEAKTVAPALMTFAGATGASVGAALVVVGADVTGSPRSEGLERMAESFLVGIVWVAAVAAVLFAVGFRAEENRVVAVFAAVRRLRDRLEVVFGSVLVVTAVLVVVDAGASIGWWTFRPGAAWVWIPGATVVAIGGATTWWLRSSARSRISLFVGAAAVVGWLVVADPPALSLFGVRLGFGSFTDWAIALTLLLPLGVVVTRLVGALRSRRERRTLAIIWDVGSFFPRWFHPFAPPAYGPVAVPDLARVVASSVDGSDRLLLACHSQGSVVAVAALGAYGVPNDRVALLTFGSPLGSLYRRLFPAHFDDALFDELRLALTGPRGPGWVNLYRRDDPIGGPVHPEVDLPPLDDPNTRVHGGYWFEPAYGTSVARLRSALGI